MKKEVCIVAGGESLKDFDFYRLFNKDTIVVNKSIFYVPNPTYFITMDYSFLYKIDLKWFDNIYTSKFFVVNFVKKYGLELDKGRICDKKHKIAYDNLHHFNTIIYSKHEEGIGWSWNRFTNGKNSGFCALQLAVLLGYQHINLLGIDLNTTTETHFHGGYGEELDKFNVKLIEYYDLFEKGLEKLKGSNVNVFNCSINSKLNNILPYKEI